MGSERQELPITRDAELRELVEHLRACGRFAFDTEFVSEETFEPVLGLIQVATRDRLAAIDPLAVRDLAPFWDVVTDPEVELVMHAAGEDLRICRLRTGRLPTRLFDVQIAAGLAGFNYPLSLGNLVGQGLGVSLAGGETRTDWRHRPLSTAQIRYALDDVRHLLDLADLIRGRLEESGRTAWAEEEMRAFLATVRSRGEEERWRRLPGLNQLSRRGLEVARRLSDWRQEEARRTNRPVRQVLRDDLLVAVARRQPTSRRDLEALRDFQRPHLLSKAAEFLAIVAAAHAVPAEALPHHLERRDEPPGLSMVTNLLVASLAHRCSRSKVAPGLVATTQDLKDLVFWHTSGDPEDARPALARGWRAEFCGQDLLDVLAGRVALRVVAPTADVPVALERLGPDALTEPDGEPPGNPPEPGSRPHDPAP